MATRQSKAAPEVVCPHCGHRFRLEHEITAHLQADWERQAKQRLRRDLREEEAQKAGQRARQEVAKELREKDEELQAKDRKLRRVERQLQTASRKAAHKPAQELGVVRQE